MNEDTELTLQEPIFEDWTTCELFEHLIDLHQIPYEEEFEDWKYFRPTLLEWCKETYAHT